MEKMKSNKGKSNNRLMMYWIIRLASG